MFDQERRMILGVIMNPDKTPNWCVYAPPPPITFLIRTFDVFVVTVTAKQVQKIDGRRVTIVFNDFAAREQLINITGSIQVTTMLSRPRFACGNH